MEPKKHEVGKPFTIKNWWWESGITINNKLKSAIKNGLKIFSEYINADGVDKESLGRIY
jgi:hypothetical protein